MELRRYLAILRRRWLLVVACLVAALAGAWFATPDTSVFAAQSVIYVGSRQLAGASSGQISSEPLLAAERITTTFAEMLDSPPIAADATAKLGLDRAPQTVVGQTRVSNTPGTQLLRVTVSDTDPDVARDLANALADAFVAKVQTFEPGVPARPGDVPTLPAYVFQRATVPDEPVPGGRRRNLLLAGGFGLVTAIGLALLLEYLDLTIRTAADAERRLGLPVLAVIPFTSPGRSRG